MKRLTHVINQRRSSKSIPRTKSVSERLRTLCLSFPGTSERASWGHPNFLAGKKAFVTFEYVHGRPSIAFRLDEDEIERLTGPIRKTNQGK
jgi:predicted DNA-binding protein (MmcQ/YjbR family)